MRAGTLLLVATALLLVPTTASAEFGPESDQGWPINVHGDEITPPVPGVPAMLANPYQAADPVNKPGPLTLYPYYPILVAELQRLASEHPDLVKLTSVGQSTLGLDIWMLEIADFTNPDMLPLEDREVVYIDGGTHSNEYSGVYFVTELAQFLLDEYETNETAKWIVENRHTYIVPMVNPDGSHVFGRLNAALVNVNRNYPVLWNEIDESPIMNNPGPAPASEPETQTVVALFEQLRPDYMASIHCCGNLWLYPYGVEGYEAVDEQAYSAVCDEVYPDVRDRCGPIWSTIYPASGTTTDTAYDHVGSFSWGFEMSGRGAVALWGQPIIVDDVRTQERESWRGVMHAFLNVERYGAHPVLTSLAGSAGELVATIVNDGFGDLHEGALTIDGVEAELPYIPAGGTTELALRGDFAEGAVDSTLTWTKRIMQAPQGHAYPVSELVDEGGELVGVLNTMGSPVQLTGAESGNDAPGPSLAGLVVALAAAAVAVVRRRT